MLAVQDADVLEVRIAEGTAFPLPRLQDLLGAFGNAHLTDRLPAQVRDLRDLSLSDLTARIDVAKGVLDRLSLTFHHPRNWLPGVSSEDLDLRLDISSETGVTGQLRTSFLLAGTRLRVYGELRKAFKLRGYLTTLDLSALANEYLKGFPADVPAATLNDVAIELSSQGALCFRASVSNLGFQALAQAFNVALPAGIASFDLSTLCVHVNGASWKVTASTDALLRFPESGTEFLEMSKVSVTVSNEGFGCAFDLAGEFHPGKGVAVDVPPLHVSYDPKKKWCVRGSANVKAYWLELTNCIAAIDDGVFSLSYQRTLDFGSPPFGSARIDRFECRVKKEAGRAGEINWGFDVEGRGRIEIGRSLLAADFDITLSVDKGDKKLSFVSHKPHPVTVPLGTPVAGHTPALELEPSEIRIEADSTNKTWSFQTNATGTLRDIPEVVQDYFPSELPEGELRVDEKGIAFDCALPPGQLQPRCRLFSVKADGKEIVPEIAVPKLGAQLGEAPNVHCILHIELPAALNCLFGAKQGKPRVVFLNPSFDLSLSIGKQLRLALANNTSPFRKLKFDTDEKGNQYFLADFGPGFNRFKINVPVLTYAGDSWTGSAGMTVLDPPIRVPLVPLAFVLRQLKVPRQIIKYIPDSVPIDVVDFNKHKTFRSVLESALQKPAVAALYDSGAKAMLEEFDKFWKKIARALAGMPKDFRGYARPPDIRRLNVNLGASPGGGWSGGLETDGRRPVSFMLPMVGTIPPELVGFSLKAVEFGQAAGGGLATFKIDGCIDRFDIVTLALAIGSIASKRGTAPLTPTEVKQLANHVELNNVFGIAFPGFPLPIPLLYDKMSWRYKNWWGLGGQAQAELYLGPDTTIWTVLEALIPFAIDPDFKYKLHQHAKEGPKLTLQIGPDNLRLPQFLGGRTIGPKAGTPEMPTDYSIRYLLDAFKFTNPGYAIRAIPLKHPKTGDWIRLGFKPVAFGPLSLKAGWCITTEEEFRKDIVGDSGAKAILGQLDADKTLKRIPRNKQAATYDKGFIVLLAAGFGAGTPKINVLSYSTQFGMAVTSTGGLETGIYMEGAIGPLALTIEGSIEYSRQGVTTIAGSTELLFGKSSLVHPKGGITVTEKSFDIGVDLILSGTCTLGGTFHIGSDKVYIEGRFVWNYAANQRIAPSYKVSALFDKNGLLIQIQSQKLFGSPCDVGIYVDQRGIGARAWFDVRDLQKPFLQGLEDSFDRAKKEVDANRAALNQLIESNIEKTKDFDDVRRGLPSILTSIRNRVINAVRNEAGRQYDRLGGWQLAGLNGYYGAKAWNLGKKLKSVRRKLQNDAVKQARGYCKPIDTLVVRLKAIGDDKDKKTRIIKTKTTILRALNDGIALQNKKQAIKVWKIPVKTIRIKDYIPRDQNPFDDLVKLRNYVQMLPGEWAKEEAKRNEIAKSAAKYTEVKSITFDTPLVRLSARDAEVTVEVQVKRNQAPKAFTAKVRLNSLPKSMPAVTDAFVKAIG